jgi:hypothetical protein
MENLLNFSQWGSSLNESKTTDRIVNSLGKLFGGKTSKMEKILNEIFLAKREYLKEWEKSINDIEKAEKDLAIKEKITPKMADDQEEILDLKQKIKSINRVIDAAEDKMSIKVRNLMTKGEELYKGNARLKSYWNVRSSEYDLEFVSLKHKAAKKLSNKSLQEKIFGEYKTAEELLKRRSRQLEETYGSLAADTKEGSKKLSNAGSKLFRTVVGMDSKEFKEYLKTLEKAEVSQLTKYIDTEISRLTADRKSKLSKIDRDREANGGKTMTSKQKEDRALIRNIEKDVDSYKNKRAILRNEK